MKSLLFVFIVCLGLFVGAFSDEFKPNEKLKKIPEKSVLSLGLFVWERPEGEPATGWVTDYSGMTYDVHNHRVLLFGGGHSATWTDAIYAFDFQDLKWKSLYKPTPHKYYTQENFDKGFWKSGDTKDYPRPVGRHTYDLLVVPDDRKEFLMLRTGTGPSSAAKGFGYVGGAGGSYDFKEKKWTMIDGKLLPFGGYGGVCEYDPIGKVVVGIMGQGVYVYDPDKKTCTRIMKDNIDKYKEKFGYSGSLVYYPPNKKMYIFGPNMKNVWALNLNREDYTKSTLEEIENSGDFPKAENSYVYDTKNQIIGGGVFENKFFVFDPAKGKWSSEPILGGEPKKLLFHCIAYSPIDNAYIFIGVDRNVWAYRWK